MVKLNAKKVKIDNNEYVLISEDSFDYLLSCLDNQKFLPKPSNQSPLEKSEIQKYIDLFNRQCRDMLHNGDINKDIERSMKINKIIRD